MNEGRGPARGDRPGSGRPRARRPVSTFVREGLPSVRPGTATHPQPSRRGGRRDELPRWPGRTRPPCRERLRRSPSRAGGVLTSWRPSPIEPEVGLALFGLVERDYHVEDAADLAFGL